MTNDVAALSQTATIGHFIVMASSALEFYMHMIFTVQAGKPFLATVV